MAINSWTFSGFVGGDAELRSTASGEKVLSFRVASEAGYGDRRKTTWTECSFWGKRGESVADYVKKGMKVTVIGEVGLEEFQRRDGTPGSKLAVRVTDLDLPPRSESSGQQAGGGGGRDYGSEPPRGGAGGRGGGKPAFGHDLDDEVPFVAV